MEILDVRGVPPPYVVVDGEGGLARSLYGWEILIPREIVEKSELRAIAFYLHCFAHWVLYHHVRKARSLVEEVWDAAADYVANSLLFSLYLRYKEQLQEYTPLVCKAIPTLAPYRKDWAKLSVEQVYHLLMNNPVKQRFCDAHSSFTYGCSFNDALVLEQLREGHVYGGDYQSNRKMRCEIIPCSVPPRIVNAVMQLNYVYREDLDLLQLSFGRIDTYWCMQSKLTALHIVDVSESMVHDMNNIVSACWSVVNANYTLSCGRAEQIVVLADVKQQSTWHGYEPDGMLRKILTEIVGLGGTKLFSACLKDMERMLTKNTMLFVYSDLFFHWEDTAKFVQWISAHRNSFPCRAIIHPTKVNSQLLPYFNLQVPLSEFGLPSNRLNK